MQDVEIIPPNDKPWLWKKGQSGNPDGDTKMRRMVVRYARAKSLPAMRKLFELMNEPTASHAVQLAAALAILDRGLGKPKQTVAVEDQGRTLEEMLMAIAARREAEKAARNAAEMPKNVGLGYIPAYLE